MNNAVALDKIASAAPFLVDLRPASEVLSGIGERDFLHAGPPLEGWQEACGALRGAIGATAVRAGLASDIDEAHELAANHSFRLVPAQEHNALGTFAGIIARRTPVLVIENRSSGVRAYAALNEGRGKALRYGSVDAETLARLTWIETEFAAVLGDAVRVSGGIDLFEIMAQALQMGDDGHSRQKAASALFLAAIAPFLLESGQPTDAVARALRFLSQNDFFFLPLAMGAAKSTMVSIEGTPGSTIVTSMAFNGVRCGIRVAGLGRKWWTAPVPIVHGQYFKGYDASHAGPVIGDSEIAETLGLGAFAMAGAPALARYVGGTFEQATRFTLDMYRITLAEHARFKIPTLEFRGAPFAIDIGKVVASGIEPVFNTGIAHRIGGVGQIGAGYGRMPLSCFEAALAAMP
jgi:hypothetical protein